MILFAVITLSKKLHLQCSSLPSCIISIWYCVAVEGKSWTHTKTYCKVDAVIQGKINITCIYQLPCNYDITGGARTSLEGDGSLEQEKLYIGLLGCKYRSLKLCSISKGQKVSQEAIPSLPPLKSTYSYTC